ncbi:hypothetical protein GIB67_024550 [Kingdonia uniflora]|uniref:Uncharacterized protein n=1 Tax=Kingdonia uniflora TaxID=39325 RepID=A0A7J7LNW8_9MAGN|nr:hypothetical protein GIB67_024550 [Kingdonia uniflora]
MREKKSPGLKILWVWTFGTFAILIGSVMRNKMRDMENLINSQEPNNQTQPPAQDAAVVLDDDQKLI